MGLLFFFLFPPQWGGSGWGFAQVTFEQTYPGLGISSSQGPEIIQLSDGSFVAMSTTNLVAGNPDICLMKVNSAGVVLWTKAYGAAGNDYGRGFRQTADGGFIITGTWNNNASGAVTPATQEAYLLKVNSNGVKQWAKTYGTGSVEYGYDVIETTTSDFVLTGYTNNVNGGMYVVKTNASGVMQWNNGYGRASVGNNQGYGIAEAPNGRYVVAGSDNNAGFNNYVVRLNTDGTVVWSNSYNAGSASEQGMSIANIPAGGFIIGGMTVITGLSFEATMMSITGAGAVNWTNAYGAGGNFPDRNYSVLATADGGFAINAHTEGFSGGPAANDYFFIKTNAAGTVSWAKTYGLSASDQRGDGIFQNADGSYILNGTYGTDMYLIKTDASGVSVCEVARTPQVTALTMTVTSVGALQSSAFSTETNVTATTIETNLSITPAVFCSASTLSASINATNVLCNSQCTGTSAVTPSGGTSPYTYNWNNGQTTQTATGLCTGAYTVTVTDAASSTTTATVTITQPPLLTAAAAATNILCNGGTGSATITAGGGTPAYTYSWSPSGGNSSAATGLPAGNYTATVTDNNGCAQTQTVTITQPAAITATISSTPASCASNNGSATVNASGGTGSFTYAWNPSGQTTSTATGLAAGNYSVTITDANGCTQTASVTVSNPGTPTISLSSQNNVFCNGGNNGSATVSVSGGTLPYTYNWFPSGGTNAAATGLPAGNYTCIVTDASGCTNNQTVTITQPAAITATISSTPASCASNNGSATVSASGGTGSFTYVWNPSGQTAPTATGLAAGNYTVTITDANGCMQTQTTIVTSNNTLSVTVSSTQTGCTINNGTATANPSNGTSPYSYLWSNGQTTQTATGLSAGTYTATVTDAAGCTQTQTISVTQITGPTVTASAITSTITLGENTQLNASGGGTYSWSPAAGLNCTTCANPTATPSATTDYCVFVTDANGCTDSACITIKVEVPCGTLYIPSAFSPGNDGRNDKECVRGNCIQSLHIVIYDRWGEKVFESSNQKICWDGTYKGKPMNTAVFVYHMEAILISGEKIIKKGNISLLR